LANLSSVAEKDLNYRVCWRKGVALCFFSSKNG